MRLVGARKAAPAAWLAFVVALCAIAGCTTAERAKPEPELALEPTRFAALNGWTRDTLRSALTAFRRSCAALQERPAGRPITPIRRYGRMEAWQAVCDSAQALGQQPAPPVVRSFFERQFRPYRVTNGGDPGGLFTGYFEPLLHGSRTKTGPYTVPLRRRPDDLIRVDLGRFDGDLEGEKIYGHVQGQTLVPYYTRGEIAEGALGERDLEILWVDSRVDKFFLQIQGSGRVRLRDSTIVRVGYAAENGQPYRAIGRDLIQMDALTKENVSLQTIRRWLQNHPDRAGEVMERNRSYVFFRRLDSLSADEGPIGSQGVPLTPRRSLAVDTRYVPLGAPLWLTTEAPVPGDTSKTRPFRQLMIAQDTGGAIRGPVRGDVFWGAGDTARAIAGRMQSPGQYVILLPRSVDPPA